MPEDNAPIKLTQFAHGGGCGCKIGPQVLKEILHSNLSSFDNDEKLLVGNSSNDDAAVYDIGNGQAMIATTDFFMPIVDDAFDFGRVAAANAISDVYAMGGKPVLALAVLGWPVDKLPAILAQKVIEGARAICKQAGIVLAGGHSIDTTEPVFGLCVNGFVDIESLKKNNTAQEGDLLFVTKPIGVGILATAQKRGLLQEEDETLLINQLTQLNSIGYELGKIKGVTAMTDVTGFGLLGHLMEMAEGAGLSAELSYASVPKIASIASYMQQRIVPDATYRNWNAYSANVGFGKGVNVMEAFTILPDPQTNGGLLFSVNENSVAEVQTLLQQNGLENFMQPIGKMVTKEEKTIRVEA
jgi:selenide,water dikinase